MNQRLIHVFLLATTLWLASCGGGTSSSSDSPTAAAAARAMVAARDAAPQRRALSTAGPVDATDAANQLMDFAEVRFPEFFPGHPATGSALGYLYRHYESTGIYLGVREGQVYVLGGIFGGEVLAVGALTQFITPQQRVSARCAQAGVSHAVFATPNAQVGRNAGITLAGCSGAIGSPQWLQTAGPALTLAADKTQTISFDPPQAGNYGFELRFVGSDGARRTENVSLAVAAAEPAAVGVTVRASHSVRMGGKVSVRAWAQLPADDAVKAVTWTQIEGPPVTLDTSTSRLAVFTAPDVTRDTVVRLRATLHTDSGRVANDEVMVLVERYTQAPASDEAALWGGAHVARVYAYKSSGPYATALRRCVYDAEIHFYGPGPNLCTLGTLPFLAQDTGGGLPTVEQVMSRVLVSHDWLGRNFENFLRTHDTRGDYRRMLNSVTAIVLSTHVRPSFYSGLSGAIYLDGDSFWLTPEERDTMNEAPDYRSDFGNGLQYDTLWRYVRDNKSIFAYFDPRQRITRTLDDVHNEAGWLLFHELAHALDYLPPSAYAGLDRSLGVWLNIYPRWEASQLTSDTVALAYPLNSSILAGLGHVRFRGLDATSEQKAYTPAQIASAFSTDVATDDYSYSTSREDVAMTLEEFLMQRRHGIRRDFAISGTIDRASGTSSSVPVHWGQRGRIGEAAIRARTRVIVRQLAPWADEAEVDLLPAPTAMRAGESWGANLEQPAIPRRARAANEPPTLQQMWQFQRELQRMQHHRHHGAQRLPPAMLGAARPAH
ncbi:hypothetical protein HLB44_01110 [Aquincola sp. S2]|uniref:Peptidase M60 domain-containing protein n=1 Tax=Pseudaquabacterium terrae TaxID=2732868 RepID=A0ABX2EA34_9BURK|nr:hypothetical protein [Aquabacterium terrae]